MHCLILLLIASFSVLVYNSSPPSAELDLENVKLLGSCINISSFGSSFVDTFLGIVNSLSGNVLKRSFGQHVIKNEPANIARELLNDPSLLRPTLPYFESHLNVDEVFALSLNPDLLPKQGDGRWSPDLAEMAFKVFPHGHIMSYLYTISCNHDQLIWSLVSKTMRQNSLSNILKVLASFLDTLTANEEHVVVLWFGPSFYTQMNVVYPGFNLYDSVSQSDKLVDRLSKYAIESKDVDSVTGGISIIFVVLNKDNFGHFLDLVKVANDQNFAAVRTEIPLLDFRHDYTESIFTLYSKVLELCIPENPSMTKDLACESLIGYLRPAGGLNREQIQKATEKMVNESRLGKWSCKRFLVLMNHSLPIFPEIFRAMTDGFISELIKSHKLELSRFFSQLREVDQEIVQYLFEQSKRLQEENVPAAICDCFGYMSQEMLNILASKYQQEVASGIESMLNQKVPDTQNISFINFVSSLDLQQFEKAALCQFITKLPPKHMTFRLLEHFIRKCENIDFEKAKEFLISHVEMHYLLSKISNLLVEFYSSQEELNKSSLHNELFKLKLFNHESDYEYIASLLDELSGNLGPEDFFDLFIPDQKSSVMIFWMRVSRHLARTEDIAKRHQVMTAFLKSITKRLLAKQIDLQSFAEIFAKMCTLFTSADVLSELEQTLISILDFFSSNELDLVKGILSSVVLVYVWNPNPQYKPSLRFVTKLCKLAEKVEYEYLLPRLMNVVDTESKEIVTSTIERLNRQ